MSRSFSVIIGDKKYIIFCPISFVMFALGNFPPIHFSLQFFFVKLDVNRYFRPPSKYCILQYNSPSPLSLFLTHFFVQTNWQEAWQVHWGTRILFHVSSTVLATGAVTQTLTWKEITSWGFFIILGCLQVSAVVDRCLRENSWQGEHSQYESRLWYIKEIGQRAVSPFLPVIPGRSWHLDNKWYHLMRSFI
jgi:hypothetical protein